MIIFSKSGFSDLNKIERRGFLYSFWTTIAILLISTIFDILFIPKTSDLILVISLKVIGTLPMLLFIQFNFLKKTQDSWILPILTVLTILGINIMVLSIDAENFSYYNYYVGILILNFIFVSLSRFSFKLSFLIVGFNVLVYIIVGVFIKKIYGNFFQGDFFFINNNFFYIIFSSFVCIVLSYVNEIKDKKSIAQKSVISRNYKFMRKQKRELEDSLKQSIESRELAERANNEKSRFLANMSHEIRTPLNSIIGSISIVEKTELTDYQKKYLRIINISGNNLLHLINDILEVSKIEYGEITLEEKDFNLFSELSNTVKINSVKAEEKAISLTMDYPKESENLIVIGDSFRLNQVLNNLIANGIKFTKEGYVKVIVEILKEDEFEIDLKILVEDTGIGIKEENMKNIFNPFVQAENGIARKFGGTGLGLSICKKLLEIRGSKLEVKSEFGKGSQFYFVMNYKKGNIEEIIPENNLEIDISKYNIKILIAEDMIFNQIVLRELIKSYGCEIDIANNGLEAIDLFTKNDYDIILMDINMPELDGVEATKRIRRLSERGKIVPIYFLSADAIHLQENAYKEAQATGYLTKPLDELKLKNLINKTALSKK